MKTNNLIRKVVAMVALIGLVSYGYINFINENPEIKAKTTPESSEQVEIKKEDGMLSEVKLIKKVIIKIADAVSFYSNK